MTSSNGRSRSPAISPLERSDTILHGARISSCRTTDPSSTIPTAIFHFKPLIGDQRRLSSRRRLSRTRSSNLVRGNFAVLLDYFSRSPCLFVGFSLTDPGLRSMLRQASRRSPGTVHYYVRYCHSGRPSVAEQEEAREANFNLFNMVTLFLNSDEIKALFELLSMEDEAVNDVFIRAGIPRVYRYYIAGVVSVGKTSVISCLQGLEIVDEWLRPRDPLIAMPSDKLGPAERARVDHWILDQVRLKNGRFAQAREGLHVMDRAPLDAFAFTPRGECRNKAEEIYSTACAGSSGSPQSLEKGRLIILKGDPSALLTRQKWRGRGGTDRYLERQQNALVDTYSDSTCGPVTFIETSGRDIPGVTRTDHARHTY